MSLSRPRAASTPPLDFDAYGMPCYLEHFRSASVFQGARRVGAGREARFPVFLVTDETKTVRRSLDPLIVEAQPSMELRARKDQGATFAGRDLEFRRWEPERRLAPARQRRLDMRRGLGARPAARRPRMQGARQ
jgi:hypothetical protein